MTKAEQEIRDLCKRIVDRYPALYHAAVVTRSDAGWGQGYGEVKLAEKILNLLPTEVCGS